MSSSPPFGVGHGTFPSAAAQARVGTERRTPGAAAPRPSAPSTPAEPLPGARTDFGSAAPTGAPDASGHAPASQAGLAQTASTRMSGWSAGGRPLPAGVAGAERTWTEASHALETLEGQLEHARGAASSLDEKAGWKESFLWGAFGDRELRSQLKTSRGSVQELEAQVDTAKDARHEAWTGYRAALTQALLAEHPELAPRQQQVEALANAVEWGSAALGSVRHGLQETDEAQTMETVDLAGNNVGVSLLSTQENEDVTEQLGRVRQNLAGLEAAVARARALGAQAPEGGVGAGPKGLDDFPDFLLDVALSAADFGVFDFMSWENLGKLDEIEDALARLEHRLQPLVEQLGDVHVRAAEGWDAQLDAYRARFDD